MKDDPEIHAGTRIDRPLDAAWRRLWKSALPGFALSLSGFIAAGPASMKVD
jgi:hypothetical protein